MMRDGYKRQSGRMGAMASQPTQGISSAMTVDPLERLNQRMAGRMEGGDMRKQKKQSRVRQSLMANYGACDGECRSAGFSFGSPVSGSGQCAHQLGEALAGAGGLHAAAQGGHREEAHAGRQAH